MLKILGAIIRNAPNISKTLEFDNAKISMFAVFTGRSLSLPPILRDKLMLFRWIPLVDREGRLTSGET